MMKTHKHITRLVLLLLLAGCQNRELSPDDGCGEPRGNTIVEVIIHWDEDETAYKPEEMVVHLFNIPTASGKTDTRTAVTYQLSPEGGLIQVDDGTYLPVCFDFSGNSEIYFRHQENPDLFEAYLQAQTYMRTRLDIPTDEPLVNEPSPTRWYAAQFDSLFTVDSYDGQVKEYHMDFYPHNVLHEFTFLIYGVKGAKNTKTLHGSISGMAASYFLVQDSISEERSTLLFNRIRIYRDGQKQAWTDKQKEDFARRNPDWNNPETGWTGDWVTGSFCIFGPVTTTKDDEWRHVLAIDAVAKNDSIFSGQWGYYNDKWEDIVSKQLEAAYTHKLNAGTKGEGEDDTKHVGTFDIVIPNWERLNIPDSAGDLPQGFDPGVEGWDNIEVVL